MVEWEDKAEKSVRKNSIRKMMKCMHRKTEMISPNFMQGERKRLSQDHSFLEQSSLISIVFIPVINFPFYEKRTQKDRQERLTSLYSISGRSKSSCRGNSSESDSGSEFHFSFCIICLWAYRDGYGCARWDEIRITGVTVYIWWLGLECVNENTK